MPGARAVALVPVLLALLAGCALLSGEPPRDSSGQVTADADAGALTLKVGDCISDMDGLSGEVGTVPVTPCETPHQGEVFAEKLLTESELPEDVATQAEEFCIGEVVGFLGGEPTGDLAELEVVYLAPTTQTWVLGDRAIQCVIYSTDGGLTGSLRDSAR